MKLQTRQDRLRMFLLGGCIGVLAFLCIFGFSSLDLSNVAFARGGYVEKDIQQHYAGWLFFRDSSWQFPLGVADNMNYPDGVSIAFTDSIPLFGVLFKLFSAWLPDPCQYFGWFSLWCYFMMGGYSILLLNLFIEKVLPCALGTVLFVCSPILVERTLHHTSLAAQFFVIYAIYCYFRSDQEKKLYIPWWNILILSIHPYFVPMTYAVTLALVIRYGQNTGRWLKGFGALAGSLAGTVAVGWLFGLFYTPSTGGSLLLYGYFNLNLNALWNPTSIGDTDPLGYTLWSRFLPVQNQVGGNYDAFAYLGLGVLLTLVIAVIWAIKEYKTTFRFILRHFALLVCMFLLCVFAVSNVVTANGATLFRIPLPQKIQELASIFRASGRMFWPTYYLLFLWAVVTLSRFRKKEWLPSLAIGVLCLVQLVDISPALIGRHTQMAQYQEQNPTALTSDFWTQAAGQYDHLFTLDTDKGDILHLALYAAENDMTTNDAFPARYDAANLMVSREETLNGLLDRIYDPDTLYYTTSEGLFLRIAHYMQDDAYCAKVGENQYVIAPGFEGEVTDAVEYSADYPITIEPLTDGQWDGGVLDEDDCTILLSNCYLVHQLIDDADAIMADGIVYPIVKVEEVKRHWLWVTLDIEDARILKDVILEAAP